MKSVVKFQKIFLNRSVVCHSSLCKRFCLTKITSVFLIFDVRLLFIYFFPDFKGVLKKTNFLSFLFLKQYFFFLTTLNIKIIYNRTISWCLNFLISVLLFLTYFLPLKENRHLYSCLLLKHFLKREKRLSYKLEISRIYCKMNIQR